MMLNSLKIPSKVRNAFEMYLHIYLNFTNKYKQPVYIRWNLELEVQFLILLVYFSSYFSVIFQYSSKFHLIYLSVVISHSSLNESTSYFFSGVQQPLLTLEDSGLRSAIATFDTRALRTPECNRRDLSEDNIDILINAKVVPTLVEFSVVPTSKPNI